MKDYIGGGELRAGDVDDKLEGSREPFGESDADLASGSGSSTDFERRRRQTTKQQKQQNNELEQQNNENNYLLLQSGDFDRIIVDRGNSFRIAEFTLTTTTTNYC